MMSKNNEAELTSEEEKLILQLNHSNIKELKPLISPDGTLSYTELKDLPKDFKFKHVQHLLSDLADKGFLKETGKKSMILCPRCSSHRVSSVYCCVKCGSDDVERLDFIEHLHCGYIDERKLFEDNFQLVCPNCGLELSFSESNDDESRSRYRIVGTNFACNNCESKFERPNVTHECQECGVRFTFKNSNYIKLVSYELTEKSLQLTPENAIQDVVEIVQKKLEAKGLEVTMYGEASGKSLGSHSFDIIARAEPNLIVGDISVKSDSSGLIALIGKKMDVNPTSTFFIDISGSFKNSDFGKEQNIASFNGLSEDFAEDFENYLNGVDLEPMQVESQKNRKRFGIF